MSLADRLMSILASVESPGLGLVRGRARLRQRALAAGLDGDGHGNANARLCRCRIEIAALADDATNGIGRSFPPRRHRRLRRAAATSPRLRSAAGGSHGLDRCLPCGVAGGWRCRVESHRNARLRVVSRQQRSVRRAGRSAAPAVAATDCIPIAPTKIAVASRSVSYLLGLAEIRQLARVNAGLTKPAALRAVGA